MRLCRVTGGYILHPAPYTLHSTPYTLHPELREEVMQCGGAREEEQEEEEKRRGGDAVRRRKIRFGTIVREEDQLHTSYISGRR